VSALYRLAVSSTTRRNARVVVDCTAIDIDIDIDIDAVGLSVPRSTR
jgi:hypothetical protein